RRKAGAALAAIDMRHIDRTAGDALQRMQDDEAGAISDEIPGRRSTAGEAHPAVRIARDLRRPGQVALRGSAERLEAQAKATLRLAEIESGDLRAGRAPVAIAHEK